MQNAQSKWGIPIEVGMAIMWRESRFSPTASPGTSSAFGFSQAIDGTWDWYREATGERRARRDRFDDAADFVGWYMTQTQRTNGLPFHDSYRHYLAYHEGHAGYMRGSYRSKPRLLNAAFEVEQMTALYRDQLRTCR